MAFNKTVSLKTAKKINNIFTEVVIAPQFSNEAKKLLFQKQNLILLEFRQSKTKTPYHIKSTRNFLLIQEKDNENIKLRDLIIKTKKKPNDKLVEDMIFAFTVSKYLNSNAIVLANNLSTVGIGVGQTNRLDAAKQAINRKIKL